jgi:glutamate-1-semialdehyde 2,1-aminomutase
VYEQLDKTATRLEEGIAKAAAGTGIELNFSRISSLLTIFFTSNAALNYESVAAADTARFSRFFWQLLEQGIYWPPSQFEAAFISLAHSEEDIRATVSAIDKAFNSLAT